MLHEGRRHAEVSERLGPTLLVPKTNGLHLGNVTKLRPGQEQWLELLRYVSEAGMRVSKAMSCWSTAMVRICPLVSLLREPVRAGWCTLPSLVVTVIAIVMV